MPTLTCCRAKAYTPAGWNTVAMLFEAQNHLPVVTTTIKIQPANSNITGDWHKPKHGHINLNGLCVRFMCHDWVWLCWSVAAGLLQLFHLGMECRLMDVDGCYVLLWCKCTFIGMVVLVMQHVVLTESWLFPCLGMQCYCRMVFVQGCYGLVWHEVSLQVHNTSCVVIVCMICGWCG